MALEVETMIALRLADELVESIENLETLPSREAAARTFGIPPGRTLHLLPEALEKLSLCSVRDPRALETKSRCCWCLRANFARRRTKHR